MAVQNLALDSFWVDKSKYDNAEKIFYERQANETLTPLAAEVAKARQRIIEMKREVDEGVLAPSNNNGEVCCKHESPKDKSSKNSKSKKAAAETAKEKPFKEVKLEMKPSVLVDDPTKTEVGLADVPSNMPSIDTSAIKFFEKKMHEFSEVIAKLQESLQLMDVRLSAIERKQGGHQIAICPPCPLKSGAGKSTAKAADDDDDDEDVDLFGSESDDDEAAAKIKEERLAAYNAKKSKKPVLIAKSSIVLDVKPWDDETDLNAMEDCVRAIQCEGLLWGASKQVPLAYGICKLQISCVVEDDKVSVDWLQEQIEGNDELVQSVDIAAFNKI